jgi:hypothetical protein
VALLVSLGRLNSGGVTVGTKSLPSVDPIDRIDAAASSYNGLQDAYPEFPRAVADSAEQASGTAFKVAASRHTAAARATGPLGIGRRTG